MKIGIRAHDLGFGHELISSLKSSPFATIQLAVEKALKINVLTESLNEWAEQLTKSGITTALIGCYFNPVHPDVNKIEQGIKKWEVLSQNHHLFHCSYLGTETGSLNGDKWTYHPDNHLPAPFEQVVAVVKRLIQIAERDNTYVLIEPAYNHVICDLPAALELKKRINSKHLKFILDPFNLIKGRRGFNYQQIVAEFVQALAADIVIVHLKDYQEEEGAITQVPIGTGVVNFPQLFRLLAPLNATAIIEGEIDATNAAEIFDYLKSAQNA